MIRTIIIIVIILLVIVFFSSSNDSEHSKSSSGKAGKHASGRSLYKGVQTNNGRVTSAQIKALYNSQDKNVQSNSQQRQVVSEIKRYQHTNTRSVQSTNSQRVTIDLSWSDNLEELIEATGVLYSNAQMTCNSRMESARFEYYKDLHYRSFTAADLCQMKIDEIKPHYDQINRLIMRLNDRSDSLRVDTQTYKEIIQIKDSMKAIIAFLKERRDTLNHQTKALREKIGRECGRGGAEWEARILAKHVH